MKPEKVRMTDSSFFLSMLLYKKYLMKSHLNTHFLKLKIFEDLRVVMIKVSIETAYLSIRSCSKVMYTCIAYSKFCR